MSDEQQVEDNLTYASRSSVGMVTEEEKEVYRKAKEIYDSMALVGCTGCRYCMPCPFGLDIPGIFTQYNRTAAHQEKEAKEAYEAMAVKADACRACHQKNVWVWRPNFYRKVGAARKFRRKGYAGKDRFVQKDG